MAGGQRPPPAATADQLVESVRAGGLLTAGGPVVVMLSGGRDSVCLLDVAVRVAGPAAVTALHVNYGLRTAAAGDEALCDELCERLAVALTVCRPGRPPEPGNVQAWAREVRYAEAAALATSRAADVAAAHTATDQVETILYRLASSPSRRALLGMRPREGRAIRPLLECTREQVTSYCRERDLRWRDDESNESSLYARGRVRKDLVPALREIHPAAEANVLAVAVLLREEADVLDALVDGILEAGGCVSLARLRALPAAIARLVVQRLADAAAGRPAPGSARRLDDILALRDTGTASLDLPSGVRATAARGVLSFSPQPDGDHRIRRGGRP